MEPVRSSERKGCCEVIEFTVAVLNDNRVRFIDLTGRAINMSKEGLCFITRYPLRSGYVLKFKHDIGEYGEGLVMWIKELGDQYIAGARLIPSES